MLYGKHDQKEVFDYLTTLKDGTATNMWDAASYLVREFGVADKESNDVLCDWVDSLKDWRDVYFYSLM